ncbi:MgtC/SapB family protein [Cohnella suwonensis]|uniref:MgtC/SapB family protein n=1 Tax=Cohnella suwonensis TaxID=696072 RepID=A0ABW0LUE5_9BACL
MNSPWEIDNAHLIIRLLLSVLLGGLIGFERERKNHAAGLRTHTLVCLGSCLIMMLSMYGFADFVNEPNVRLDPARLAAQVITGVGFLGAGTILFTGKSITGLTTAASIWVVMAIGLTVGAGFYLPAVFSVIMVLLILWGLNIVEKRFVNHRSDCSFTITTSGDGLRIDDVQRLLTARGVKLVKVRFAESEYSSDDPEAKQRRIAMTVVLPDKGHLLEVADELSKIQGVIGVAVE